MFSRKSTAPKCPPRPKPPSLEMMESDIQAATSDDPVFVSYPPQASKLQDINADAPDVQQGENNQQLETNQFYSKAEEFLRANRQLEQCGADLDSKCAELIEKAATLGGTPDQRPS